LHLRAQSLKFLGYEAKRPAEPKQPEAQAALQPSDDGKATGNVCSCASYMIWSSQLLTLSSRLGRYLYAAATTAAQPKAPATPLGDGAGDASFFDSFETEDDKPAAPESAKVRPHSLCLSTFYKYFKSSC